MKILFKNEKGKSFIDSTDKLPELAKTLKMTERIDFYGTAFPKPGEKYSFMFPNKKFGLFYFSQIDEIIDLVFPVCLAYNNRFEIFIQYYTNRGNSAGWICKATSELISTPDLGDNKLISLAYSYSNKVIKQISNLKNSEKILDFLKNSSNKFSDKFPINNSPIGRKSNSDFFKNR